MYINKELLQNNSACSKGMKAILSNCPDGIELADLLKTSILTNEQLLWGKKHLKGTKEDYELLLNKLAIVNSHHTLQSFNLKNSNYIEDSSNITDSNYIKACKDIEYSSYVFQSNQVYGSHNIICSTNINNSTNIFHCSEVIDSTNAIKSKQINHSNNVKISTSIINASYVINSSDIQDSKYIAYSSQLNNCFYSIFLQRSNNCLFCSYTTNKEYCIFNENVSEDEFKKCVNIIQDFNSKKFSLKENFATDVCTYELLPSSFQFTEDELLQIQQFPNFSQDILNDILTNLTIERNGRHEV